MCDLFICIVLTDTTSKKMNVPKVSPTSLRYTLFNSDKNKKRGSQRCLGIKCSPFKPSNMEKKTAKATFNMNAVQKRSSVHRQTKGGCS